jgi:hypothetical protein
VLWCHLAVVSLHLEPNTRTLTLTHEAYCGVPPGRPPPPPPSGQGPLALLKAALLQRKVRRGGSSGATEAVPLTDEEQYAKEAEEAEAAQMAYLDELAADNPQMRSVLSQISATVHSAGRRLWERSADAQSHDLLDNVLHTAAFGAAPITGITIAQCETLCAAVENGTVGACVGIAFARVSASARDLTLRQCILLSDLGGCTPGSFAGAVFARRGSSGCTNPTAYDNPLCVQMAQGR